MNRAEFLCLGDERSFLFGILEKLHNTPSTPGTGTTRMPYMLKVEHMALPARGGALTGQGIANYAKAAFTAYPDMSTGDNKYWGYRWDFVL